MKLKKFIAAAKAQEISCMSESSIKQQLQMTGNAIITRDLSCFLRIGKTGRNKFCSFVTNLTEGEESKFNELNNVNILI